jgi:hypothetical protein
LGAFILKGGKVMASVKELTEMQNDGNQNIIDQFAALQDVGHMLAVLRDGIRNAETNKELWAWKDIVDMALEHEVDQVNDILSDLCKNFSGLRFQPIKVDGYSLLRKIE